MEALLRCLLVSDREFRESSCSVPVGVVDVEALGFVVKVTDAVDDAMAAAAALVICDGGAGDC